MSRTTCEESKRLDATEFARKGWLRPGLMGTQSWTRGREPSGNIGWRTTLHSLVVSYTITDWRGDRVRDARGAARKRRLTVQRDSQGQGRCGSRGDTAGAPLRSD